MTSRARPLLALLALSLVAVACGNRNPVPERTTQGTNLNLNATAMTPEVHINARDGGATGIQIGNAQAQLPGEGEHRAAAAEREAEDNH